MADISSYWQTVVNVPPKKTTTPVETTTTTIPKETTTTPKKEFTPALKTMSSSESLDEISSRLT